MCVRAIESDVSMSSITFGLAWAAVVVTIGALSMSVTANANVEGVSDSARVRARQPRPRDNEMTSFMLFSLALRGSLQNDLCVAHRAATPVTLDVTR